MNVVLIRKRMAEMRLKPIQLAAQIGVSLPTIHRILNGESKRPHDLTVRALAEVLGVTEEDLFPDRIAV